MGVYVYIRMSVCMYVCVCSVCVDGKMRCRYRYGVATISRLLKFIDLFCKRAL